ncbi:helix-turn-helix transcriptional regulator [Photobacterium ganghwense]|uniref:helix-turn-helix transcriptional regulator n=1 Tax=Photobacterium ganghwense TaxID=320778 RepID=UPI001C2DB9BD|nr:helix-turn-helix transcriptional regulator [Photobacterium ganghwense]MBV1842735.1 helix-turn-helix domain-containing protein [Photobacterium ganghwense]
MSNIKAIRTSINASQDELAEHVGVTQGAIAHFEKGIRTPNIKMCWRIVEALNRMGANCSFEDVFPTPSAQDNSKNTR